MYKIEVIENSPTKATVIVESGTLKEQYLLRSGRIQDALVLMNDLELLVNTGSKFPYYYFDHIKNLKSYDPTNK